MLWYAMICCGMVWYVMVCRVVSCCVTTCHDILRCTISCHDVICYAVLWAVRADFLYVFRKSSRLDVCACGHDMVCHVTQCYDMQCYVALFSAMLCEGTSINVAIMLRYDMLYCVACVVI